MRCIDADALIDDLKHDVAVNQDSLDYEELTDSNRENIQFDKDCKQNAIDLLQHAPTIEPRKKGMWIYGESEVGNDGYYCSKCGNFVPWKYGEYDIDFIKEFLFCNKCGAEMRTPVEIARNIVHKVIDNSVWSDTVDTAKMHKVVDDKYAEIRGDANVDANT